MAFMELELIRKGQTYTSDCDTCGSSMFTHEWVHDDHNERRDAMEAGTLRCDECARGKADPQTFMALGKRWAGRYSASGYLDCTDWFYDSNKRRLTRDLRELYGE